jgi:hypothetical protein
MKFKIGERVKDKKAKLYRDKDGSGREFLQIGKKIIRLIGDFDCEYQRTQLIKVKTIPWKGNLPIKPFQYLGWIDGEDLEKALKMDGKSFGQDVLV